MTGKYSVTLYDIRSKIWTCGFSFDLF